MAQKKKNIGKRERDRLKKQKAKPVVHVSPESTPSDTPDSPPDEPPVPGLDATDYSRVSNLSANMDMGGKVVEKVAVDPNGRRLRVIMGGEKVMNEFSKRMDEENEVQAKLNYVAAKFDAVRAAVFGAGAKELPVAEQTKAKDELRQVVDVIGSLMKSRPTNCLVVSGQPNTLYSDGMKLILNREEPGYKAPSLKREESLRKAFGVVDRKMDDIFSRIGRKP